MKNHQFMGMALGVAVMFSAGGALADGDPENGQAVAERRCGSCHTFEQGDRNKVGPNLFGVIGRAAGTVEGFNYSDLSAAATDAGLVWTEELVVEYLPNAQDFLEDYVARNGGTPTGRTRMTFRLRDEQDRRDVAAYLATLRAE
ncbi:MAG: c-type cytochrome [Alphaproteobacteria bacterium]